MIDSIVSIKNTVFSSATYILKIDSSEDLYLIDCGDVQPVISYIETNHLSLKGVFLTHSHFDHIYRLNELV